MLTCEIVKSGAGATRRRARRGGSSRRARRSPRMVMMRWLVVMEVLLLVLVMVVVLQDDGDRRLPMGRGAVAFGGRRRVRPSVVIVVGGGRRRRRRRPCGRTLVGHSGLPLLRHQAPGHGQPSSELLTVGRERYDVTTDGETFGKYSTSITCTWRKNHARTHTRALVLRPSGKKKPQCFR